jgi:cardiolipin synthase (CMP-forming)
MYTKSGITLATFLTITRFAVIPSIVYYIQTQAWGTVLALCAYAGVTDVLDGALARLYKQETKLGALLDPLADKLLVISCYGAFAYSKVPIVNVPAWFFYAVLIKELLVLLGAGYLSLYKQRLEIKPAFIGKLAAVAHICFIWIVCLGAYFSYHVSWLYASLLWIVIGLTGAAFVYYSYKSSTLKEWYAWFMHNVF